MQLIGIALKQSQPLERSRERRLRGLFSSCITGSASLSTREHRNASHEKMKIRSKRGKSEPSTSGISSSVRRRREIRRCLMPRLPRSVGNTYCGPQSRVVIFTVQTRPGVPGGGHVLREIQFAANPSAPPRSSALCPFSPFSLSLTPGPCRRQPPATPGGSLALTRVSFAARFVSFVQQPRHSPPQIGKVV